MKTWAALWVSSPRVLETSCLNIDCYCDITSDRYYSAEVVVDDVGTAVGSGVDMDVRVARRHSRGVHPEAAEGPKERSRQCAHVLPSTPPFRLIPREPVADAVLFGDRVVFSSWDYVAT